MSDIQKKPSANPIQSLDASLRAANSLKDLMKMPIVAQRYIANYEAFSGLKDGVERFEREAFALMDIAASKPEIMEADFMSVFAGFVKTGAYGVPIQSKKWSIYTRNVKLKDGSWKKMLVVDLDAHGKREALENMPSIKKIDASIVVFKDDKFSYNPKSRQVTMHEQAWPTPKATKDTVKAAYCVVHFTDGHTEDIAISIDQIEIARSKSKMPDGDPWELHYEEMCKKTVYNRAFKELYKLPKTAVIYQQFEAPETTIDTDHQEASANQSSIAAESVEEAQTETVDQETGEIQEPQGRQAQEEDGEDNFLSK